MEICSFTLSDETCITARKALDAVCIISGIALIAITLIARLSHGSIISYPAMSYSFIVISGILPLASLFLSRNDTSDDKALFLFYLFVVVPIIAGVGGAAIAGRIGPQVVGTLGTLLGIGTTVYHSISLKYGYEENPKPYY
ncbi:MAG: hypothetical protein S4CHLAM45_04000 [Chlamydiales bacterium]|nr:hypothetical protein [Chlamydiales bacterium]MCH9619254.1 hypothetical protein [Chlamydiales bacterium]MCH9622516.1 hypothetical protein [Chlamydiales bacterium]